jgi:hypothetical protein
MLFLCVEPADVQHHFLVEMLGKPYARALNQQIFSIIALVSTHLTGSKIALTCEATVTPTNESGLMRQPKVTPKNRERVDALHKK